MKIILIGGHPKGFDEPFHIKTKSGKIIRKIFEDLNIKPELFNLWNNQTEEDSRILPRLTIQKLDYYASKKYQMIALGRYIEKELLNNNYKCDYLPHPASRDKKYIKILKVGLNKAYNSNVARKGQE